MPELRAVPAPGQAALPAVNAAALLRRNATDEAIAPHPAILFADLSWSHRDYLAESIRFANLFLAHALAHSSEHRGQVQFALARLGHEMPDLDGWAYAAAMGYGWPEGQPRPVSAG